MNSDGESQTISEAQTAKTFEQPEYRFLIVANKCQTGFDQPLLHTMYLDKKPYSKAPSHRSDRPEPALRSPDTARRLPGLHRGRRGRLRQGLLRSPKAGGPSLRRAHAVGRALRGPLRGRNDFRGQLTDYARLYTFAAQVLSFADADLDKLYVFARTAMLRI